MCYVRLYFRLLGVNPRCNYPRGIMLEQSKMISFETRNILFYAFRYALGRSTYAVQDVVEAVIDIWESLHPAEQMLYKKEIKEAIDAKKAGAAMDIVLWETILDLKVSSV